MFLEPLSIHLNFPISVMGFPNHLSNCLSFMLLKAYLDADPAQLVILDRSTTDSLRAYLYENVGGKSVNNLPLS